MSVPVEILQWYLLSLRRCGLIQRLKNCIDIIDFFCSTMTIEMFGAAFKPWVDGIPFDNSNPSTRKILNIKRNYFMQNHRGNSPHIQSMCSFDDSNLFIILTLAFGGRGKGILFKWPFQKCDIPSVCDNALFSQNKCITSRG